MTTRANLVEILEEQRQRRRPTTPPVAPVLPKKQNNTLVLIGLILLLIGTAIFFELATEETKNESPAQSAAPAVALMIASSLPATTATSTQTVEMRVCTEISNGRMQVHFDPGAGSEIRGYLREAEPVEVSERRSLYDGGMWLHLTSPMDGWANARLLCLQLAAGEK